MISLGRTGNTGISEDGAVVAVECTTFARMVPTIVPPNRYVGRDNVRSACAFVDVDIVVIGAIVQ
jgi:hypothetical protein